MDNRPAKNGAVEMAVVCSDLSLLENINSLLKQKGVITVEDEYGNLHYIVDGRNDRKAVANRVISIDPTEKEKNAKEDAYIELCIKTVLREYGFDMALIGTVLIHDSLYLAIKKNMPLPATMKGMYCETGKEYGLSYEQSERDVRYAITKSSLKHMRSRAVMRCIQSRIERRLGFRDPLD